MLVRAKKSTIAPAMKALQDPDLFVEQSGRHFVALSLAEAETLRALLHGLRARGLDGLAARDAPPDAERAALALWHEGSPLERTANFPPSSEHQQLTARQCFRFFDSELHYTPRDLSVTLRALQANRKDRRFGWFNNVRKCRRREQGDAWHAALKRHGGDEAAQSGGSWADVDFGRVDAEWAIESGAIVPSAASGGARFE